MEQNTPVPMSGYKPFQKIWGDETEEKKKAWANIWASQKGNCERMIYSTKKTSCGVTGSEGVGVRSAWRWIGNIRKELVGGARL